MNNMDAGLSYNSNKKLSIEIKNGFFYNSLGNSKTNVSNWYVATSKEIKKFNLFVQGRNIFNTKSMNVLQVSSTNSLRQSNILLPRNVIFGLRYNF
jgi:outer membrane receptor protein involved in Fe transport